MKPLKVVLISRRFWPLIGGAEQMTANLAEALLALGLRPTILTARWQKSWPARLHFRDIPVVRVPQPSQPWWGTWRYMRELSAWLRIHASQFDLAYVSMLKHDAYAAVGALRESSVPVVLRAEGGGASGDCRWQQSARFGRKIRQRCQQADAVVVPSAPIADELIAADYDPQRVRVIANGTPLGPRRDQYLRRTARQALAGINAELRAAMQTPVVVFTGRFVREKGLFELLQAWSLLRGEFPGARLWLIGSGPAWDDVQAEIERLSLRGHVVTPGMFDHSQEILAAADVFVQPSHEEGMSLSLLEAMAAELPCVASNLAANRTLIPGDDVGLTFGVGDATALAAAIKRLFSQPLLAASLGRAARRRVQQEFSIERCAKHHVQLFEELLAARRANPA